ncbi:restriction endonuclease subunit S [Bacillaceae bacterium CLA-AA-H227]|uniref:Restriction endonuclease subunit S n=1 Tax=Robertmurraya yapensis (ex Hitch et al 2024) TaxID=3133160 RepID=A0ACC6SCY2_9BACI
MSSTINMTSLGNERKKEWIKSKLKYIAFLQTGNSISAAEKDGKYSQRLSGYYPYIATKDIDVFNGEMDYDNGLYIPLDTDFKVAKKNTVLLCIEGGSAGKKIGYLNQDVCYVNKLCNFEAFPNINGKFLYYSLQSYFFTEQFKLNISGIIPGVSIEKLKNISIMYPSLEEQQKIVKYLDEKITQIDTIKQKTKVSIEELKTYKKSLISEVVTRGLNKKINLIESGIDSIPSFPEHWSFIKLKYLLGERKDKSIEGLEEPLSMSQKYGLVKTKDLDIPNPPSSNVGSRLVKVGDLVFNKLKAHLGVFSVSKYEGLVSPDYAVYYALNSENINVKYLEYLFKTPYYISEFTKYSRGIVVGLTRLYTDDFFNIKCSIPPFHEQNNIVVYLDNKINMIDKLIFQKEQFIIEMDEYKKSLIYEYVTGEKEVM